jgi:hypothetical protein
VGSAPQPHHRPSWLLPGPSTGHQAPQRPRRVVMLWAEMPPRQGQDRRAWTRAPMPGSAGSHRRPSRRTGLPGRSAVERDRSLGPGLTRPGPRSPLPHRPPTTSPPSPSRPTRHPTKPLGTPPTTGNSIRPGCEDCPPHRRDLQGHRRADADETEVIGRTRGHQPAGRRRADTGRPDSRIPDTGRLDTGRLDTGQLDARTRTWEPNGVDTQW